MELNLIVSLSSIMSDIILLPSSIFMIDYFSSNSICEDPPDENSPDVDGEDPWKKIIANGN